MIRLKYYWTAFMAFEFVFLTFLSIVVKVEDYDKIRAEFMMKFAIFGSWAFVFSELLYQSYRRRLCCFDE